MAKKRTKRKKRSSGFFSKLFYLIVIAVIAINIFTDDVPVESDIPKSDQAKENKGPWPYLSAESASSRLDDNMIKNNIYVVFDNSGSMSDQGCSGRLTKSGAAKNALVAFANNIPKGTNLGLLIFDNSGIREKVALGVNNRDKFFSAIKSSPPGSGTPLHTSIDVAYKKLTEQARRQHGYGSYHIVVVTDGEASSGENPQHIVDRILNNSPVVFHTIGFCISTRHSLNQPGRTIYKAATSRKELQEGLQGVLAESPNFVTTDFK